MLTIEKTITSMEVAEMVGRPHDKVIRDIRNIISQIGAAKNGESYFSETIYKNSQNKKLLVIYSRRKVANYTVHE